MNLTEDLLNIAAYLRSDGGSMAVDEALRLAGVCEQLAQQEPFGYWHQGATGDESDFHLHADSGNVACPNCVKLYAGPQLAANASTDALPGADSAEVVKQASKADALIRVYIAALLSNDKGKEAEAKRQMVDYALGVEPLEQPAQEPVALETVYETIIHWDEGGGKRSRRELARRIVALYADQPQHQPLTDEQLFASDEIMSLNTDLGWHMDTIRLFASVLINEFCRVNGLKLAAHGIKENT